VPGAEIEDYSEERVTELMSGKPEAALNALFTDFLPYGNHCTIISTMIGGSYESNKLQ